MYFKIPSNRLSRNAVRIASDIVLVFFMAETCLSTLSNLPSLSRQASVVCGIGSGKTLSLFLLSSLLQVGFCAWVCTPSRVRKSNEAREATVCVAGSVSLLILASLEAEGTTHVVRVVWTIVMRAADATHRLQRNGGFDGSLTSGSKTAACLVSMIEGVEMWAKVFRTGLFGFVLGTSFVVSSVCCVVDARYARGVGREVLQFKFKSMLSNALLCFFLSSLDAAFPENALPSSLLEDLSSLLQRATRVATAWKRAQDRKWRRRMAGQRLEKRL